MVTANFWQGKRVFLTGHTGFKGGWLAMWLNKLGAHVTGYALPAATTPSLFSVANIENLIESKIGDIRDTEKLTSSLEAADPEIIFHLAAQPLVGESYRDPVNTYSTNVMGTINLLEATRSLCNVKAIVIVTTDKCYENKETGQAYQESDRLGGNDPYSSSKTCTEILTNAWRCSFFSAPASAKIATARAGNVIGGGDWAQSRLIPDLLRAYASGQPAVLRNPEAIRPWQHVLEPLSGYLKLARLLYQDELTGGAWNFGPAINDCITVGEIATELSKIWPQTATWQAGTSDYPHEAKLLHLDASLAKEKLDWQPRWKITEALVKTAEWQLAWANKLNMQDFSLQQINNYSQTYKAI